MAIFDITRLLSDEKFITLTREEVEDAFERHVPHSNLAYVMRIQDFHRGGLSVPAKTTELRLYGRLHVAARQTHATAALRITVTGDLTRIRSHNGRVEIDKPLLQQGWSFKTEDMPLFVDIKAMNAANGAGVVEFLSAVSGPADQGPKLPP